MFTSFFLLKTYVQAALLLQGTISKDEKQAVALLEKSITLGSAYAMQKLSDCYVDGIGVVRDTNRARELRIAVMQRQLDQVRGRQAQLAAFLKHANILEG